MDICIFGTGASGGMIAHSLKNLNNIDKIFIIGSDKIPSIGVGESTTVSFSSGIKDNLKLSNNELYSFIRNINASVKYGVSYEGGGPQKFLHGFYDYKDQALNINQSVLANKDKNKNVNLYNSYIAPYAYKSQVALDGNKHPFSGQFEANSLIKTLQDMAKKEPKIIHKIGTLNKVVYEDETNQKIKTTFLENGEEIKADYYINSIGSTSFNQKVFKEEYQGYNDILLTNKAIFTPIEYKDKKNEIHPYTIAKTMKYGWRGITPTGNRIGTGYVFSDKYCSVEEAKKELAKDIGQDLNFMEVDFTPRKVKKTYKENYCSIGMSGGFLEPLDAPGLAITIQNITGLKKLLSLENKNNPKLLLELNKQIDFVFNFGASFILLQYKTSHRNDTDFGKDHKKINFEFFENLYKQLSSSSVKEGEGQMFVNTMGGKDINGKIESKKSPKELENISINYIDHLELLELMQNEKNFLETIVKENEEKVYKSKIIIVPKI